MNEDAARDAIQYALCVAAENDSWSDQRLGSIHLIKYLYLADLAYASQTGVSFSGAAWKFFHYGPFAKEVWDQIVPAMTHLGAEDSTYSGISDDFIRWHFNGDAHERTALRKRLPATVSTAIDSAVRKWGGDTKALLDHVYKTEPMLIAAPNSMLEFKLKEPMRATTNDEPATARQSKLRSAAIKALKQRVAEARSKCRTERTKPMREPRYDDVYYEGVGWLEGMVEQVVPHRGTVSIDESVWTSETRRDRGDD